MRKHTTIILLTLFLSATLYPQNVEYIKVKELEKILNNPENKLFVINFWASWCGPCVNELPHFEKVSKSYADSDVTFILISLDFPGEVNQKLLPFLRKNQITLPVYAMMETDAGLWIEKADPDWQGNIPATLFLNNARNVRKFHAGELTEIELQDLIKSLI